MNDGAQVLGEKRVSRFNRQLDDLFERGIDPDVHTGAVHSHSCDMERREWPSCKKVFM